MSETTGADDALLKEALAGSAEAFVELLRPHLRMLYAYSRAICGDHHAAEDVVQETAMIAFRRLDHFFPEADFAAWLKAIARREALSARRKAAKMPALVEEAVESAYVDPTSAGGRPDREALVVCLQKLEERSAHVVRAHYFGGLKQAEIAAVMDLGLNTVKSILHRARMTLKECVSRRLGEESTS